LNTVQKHLISRSRSRAHRSGRTMLLHMYNQENFPSLFKHTPFAAGSNLLAVPTPPRVHIDRWSFRPMLYQIDTCICPWRVSGILCKVRPRHTLARQTRINMVLIIPVEVESKAPVGRLLHTSLGNLWFLITGTTHHTVPARDAQNLYQVHGGSSIFRLGTRILMGVGC
jgi:hypothetical protein